MCREWNKQLKKQYVQEVEPKKLKTTNLCRTCILNWRTQRICARHECSKVNKTEFVQDMVPKKYNKSSMCRTRTITSQTKNESEQKITTRIKKWTLKR